MDRLLSAFDGVRVGAALATAAILCALTGGAVAQEQGDPLRETHGSWEIRCVTNTPNCYMQQINVNAEGQPVLRVRIRKLPAGQPAAAIAEILTPITVFLQAGLGMKIDAGAGAVAPYTHCRPVPPVGCVASPPLGENDIASLKSGGNAIFVMRQFPTRDVVEVPISLAGFTAAFDAL